MIKSAKSIPINKILGKDDNNKELYYKIPPYQREYAWGKEQWENLFDDINNHDELGYFLGSIICIDNSDVIDVVDGQQRLTTISILLNSILSVINSYDEENPDQDILNRKKHKRNVQLYSTLEDSISYDEQIKLILSIQNSNNEDYEYILQDNGLLENINKPSNFGNRRVAKAFNYFIERLEEVDEEESFIFSIEDIFGFLNKVLSALIVKIDVDNISSAFTLFESINNRGIPLTVIDLIKNSIIGKIGSNPEITNEKWQNIVKNIENYKDQERFLRQYYHAFQKNPKVKIDKYTKATRSNIIKIYSEHIDNKDVNFIFNELIEKSDIYNLFIQPQEIANDNEFYKYKSKLIDLQRLGIAPSYSLLLYLFSEYKECDLSEVLNFIENWFIRRHLTDFPATNKLDQIFLDLSNMIFEDCNFESIKKFLTDSKRFTSNKDFESILVNEDIYDWNSNATRCLLTKLEKSKRTKESKVDFWEKTKKNQLVWTIEHIMPQNPAKNTNWLQIDEKERDDNVHRLGNLTLTCYNSSLSNKSFDDKTKVKDKNSNDIGLHSKNVKINSYLEHRYTWTIDDIETRSNILADEILKLLGD